MLLQLQPIPVIVQGGSIAGRSYGEIVILHLIGVAAVNSGTMIKRS